MVMEQHHIVEGICDCLLDIVNKIARNEKIQS